jgi:hypothetical protein
MGGVMRLSVIVLIVLLSFNPLTIADPPDTVWTKWYGGSGNDACFSVVEMNDGGYALGGYSSSVNPPLYQFYLIRTNENGDTLWTQNYGLDTLSESLSCMTQTADGGFILTGAQGGSLVDTEPFVVKVDSLGEIEWSDTYGIETIDMTSSWIEQTNDGGYVLLTYYWFPVTGFDFTLFKLNADGSIQWFRNYRWFNGDYGNCVRQTSDGGYIICGETSSNELYENDIFLLKLNASGDSVWACRYGGAAAENGYEVIETEDGGYIVAGSTESYGNGGKDVYVIKTDSLGGINWTSTFGGTYHDAGVAVIELSEGGYLVTGSGHFNGTFDGYFIRLNLFGDSLWTKLVGGGSSETLYSVINTYDDYYVAVGGTYSFGNGGVDVYLVKLYPSASGIDDIITEPRNFILSQNRETSFFHKIIPIHLIPLPIFHLVLKHLVL